MMDQKKSILEHNLHVFYIVELLRSLIFIIPIWVAFERQYISLSQLALIEVIIYATGMLCELPTGAFGDVFGKKISVALGFFIKSAALIMFGFSVNFTGFLIYAVLTGLGDSFVSGSQEALLYDTLKQTGHEDLFDKISSKLSLVFQFGIAGATIIGGFLGSMSLQLPIWPYALSFGFAGFVVASATEPIVDTEKFTVRSYAVKIRSGVQELTKTAYALKLSLYYILIGGITWSCQVLFNNTILVDLGYSPGELGITFGVLRIINSIVLFRLLNFSELFDRKRALLMFPVVMVISLLPGIWLTKWMAIPFIMGTMFASSARWVILGKYTNREYDSRHRATAISALSMGVSILYILLTWGSGPLMDWYGKSTVMFTVFGLLSLFVVAPLGIHLANAKYDKKS